MSVMPRITDQEFKERISKTQEEMKKRELDLIFAFGNEAEPQYVRYYSDYWPSFELGGVMIPVEGEPVLLIGPESETYARDRSRVKNVARILELRESSEPDYPGSDLDTFGSVIEKMSNSDKYKRAGIAGYSLVPKTVYDAFKNALEQLKIDHIERADDVVNSIRMIKSEDEIKCLEKAYEIADKSMDAVLKAIKPGMTENELKGIAVAKMYAEGAEAEGYPFWIIAGKGSNQAVSRIRNAVIREGDLVQVQVSARYEGYVSTLGRPVIIGEPTQYQLDLVNAGYTVEKEILKLAKPGLPAVEISKIHRKVLEDLGFADHILYGPVHGTGLMENEHPWVEEHSDYDLQEGMTFCTCLYLGNDEKEVGIRVENGFIITNEGAELLSQYPSEIVIIK